MTFVYGHVISRGGNGTGKGEMLTTWFQTTKGARLPVILLQVQAQHFSSSPGDSDVQPGLNGWNLKHESPSLLTQTV